MDRVAVAVLVVFAVGVAACKTKEAPACTAASYLMKIYPAFAKHGCSPDGVTCVLGLDPGMPPINCGTYKVVPAGSALRPKNVCRAPVVHEGDSGWELRLDAWVIVDPDGTGVSHLRTPRDWTVRLSEADHLRAAETDPPMPVEQFAAQFAKDPDHCRASP